MTTDPELPHRLIAAADFFAGHGVFGLVWIDRDLVVQRCYGHKVDFVTVGAPITASVIAFIGSEDYISSFQRDSSLSLELPGVVIVTSPETQDRFNLSLFFDPAQGCYYLLVARATLDSTLELELARHVRARLIAEADTNMKARELLRANRDLEQFATIVSHDLKTPMRALQYLTEDVEAAAERGDLEAVRARLKQAGTLSKRMSSMLSGLLEYSSVGRKAMAVEEVDTRSLAQSVAASIPPGTGIRIEIDGQWPVIMSLRAPLDLVLRNLVDNAVKHHDRDDGIVRISCTDGAGEGDGTGEIVISVRDDGPGIPIEQRGAVFLPFRTLAAPGRPSTGLGLGLALVQRTVESVGGRISLVPIEEDRRGATFEVRWPRTLGPRALLE